METKASVAPEWEPIESAPKDGTRILVIDSRGNYVRIAYWSSDASIFDEREGNRPHWIEFDCDDYFYSTHLINEDEPTHWMPLPEPPMKVKP